MEEIWKDIEGYEGLYQVSNFGNVKSLNYRNLGYARNLVPKTNNRGRMWVELAKNGIKKQFLVYRLVAMAFIPNDGNLPEVNHKDENISNNRSDNLEWCTREYNIRYSYNRHPEKWASNPIARTKTGRKNGDRTSLKVNQFKMDGTFVKQWPNSRTVFNETGMSDWSVSECCRGNRRKAYGFKWQYAT